MSCSLFILPAHINFNQLLAGPDPPFSLSPFFPRTLGQSEEVPSLHHHAVHTD